MRIIGLIAVVALAVLLVGACSDGDQSEPQPARIVARDFEFAPSDLSLGLSRDTLNQGWSTITNEGSTPHGFSIEQLNVHLDVPAGESVDVDLSESLADANEINSHVIIRTLRFYCRFHQGMRGEINLVYGE